MTSALNPSKKITEIVEKLPLDRQQEILDFVEFIQTKIESKNLVIPEDKPISFLEATQEFAGCLDENSDDNREKSALELAGDLVGSVEGPEDLSVNKKYFHGFGE